eukprot:GEZU01015110.1.p1 GENE.GEZU01015110.1~~GEZU01015110.1.p1  ORF type:complete len:314 (+),score=65.71 GEZU01015110.1:36-944(+)
MTAEVATPEIQTHLVNKEDDLEYDIGNLMAFDTHPINLAEYGQNPKEYLMKTARDNVQLLINHIFEIPSEQAEVGRTVVLPKPTTVLPREKPVPKEKPLSKWEKFKREKGIKTRKKDKLVFDEVTGEWRERYGKNRANNLQDDWIIPAKPGDEIGEDPFLKRQQERKKRARENKEKEMANIMRGAKERGIAVPGSFVYAQKKISEFPAANVDKRRVTKDDLKDAVDVAHLSTASMGRFDKLVDGEPKSLKPKGKRAKVRRGPQLIYMQLLLLLLYDYNYTKRPTQILLLSISIYLLRMRACH